MATTREVKNLARALVRDRVETIPDTVKDDLFEHLFEAGLLPDYDRDDYTTYDVELAEDLHLEMLRVASDLADTHWLNQE